MRPAQWRCRNSALYVAMSTPTGQSLRQPLQPRHRSSASATSAERQPSRRISPASISCSSRARPRVECCSSFVTRYDGHITPGPPGPPASSDRHFATPTHRATSRAKPPSTPAPAPAPAPGSTANRRFSSSRAGRTSIPGFIPPRGSHTSLYAPNRSITRGPYILGSSSARACPSPCSPDSDPPCATTRSASSSEKARKRATPGAVTRSKSIRTCTHPSPKCPYGVPRSPCAASRARNSRRYAPSRTGGTAQSSHPGHAIEPSGIRVAVPAASSRIRHSARCPAGSVTTTASRASAARTRPRAAPSSRISANSQAPPRGRPAAAPRTRSSAMPSTVSGPYGSRPAAASAAAPSSAYPRTARAGARGASTSRTTASVTTPSVPSLPQKARATCTPRSGSSASSPPYPEIRREKPPPAPPPPP